MGRLKPVREVELGLFNTFCPAFTSQGSRGTGPQCGAAGDVPVAGCLALDWGAEAATLHCR